MKKETSVCMCGGTMVKKNGTITKLIRERMIKVHNAPFYECVICKEKDFNLNDKISSYIVNAYKNGVSDIIYNPQGFKNNKKNTEK